MKGMILEFEGYCVCVGSGGDDYCGGFLALLSTMNVCGCFEMFEFKKRRS